MDPSSLSGPVGLIAGEGLLPVLTAERILAAGVSLYIYSAGGTNRFPALPRDRVINLFSLPGAQGRFNLQVLLLDMKSRGIAAVSLAGLVPKKIMYGAVADPVLLNLLAPGANDDHSLLGRIVAAFEKFGFAVLPYTIFLKDCLASSGAIAGRNPTEKERADVEYGRNILSVTLPLSFGQSVVVANGAVAAIEAMEGTDEMIRRAGSFVSGAGGVVVKMMRADQDERFDIPTVGTDTLRNMAAAGLSCLALEAGRTIILQPDDFAVLAEEFFIAVEGISR